MRLDPTLLSALAALSLAGCATETTPCAPGGGGHRNGECPFHAAQGEPQGGGHTGGTPVGVEEDGLEGSLHHGDGCPACGRG